MQSLYIYIYIYCMIDDDLECERDLSFSLLYLESFK